MSSFLSSHSKKKLWVSMLTCDEYNKSTEIKFLISFLHHFSKTIFMMTLYGRYLISNEINYDIKWFIIYKSKNKNKNENFSLSSWIHVNLRNHHQFAWLIYHVHHRCVSSTHWKSFLFLSFIRNFLIFIRLHPSSCLLENWQD